MRRSAPSSGSSSSFTSGRLDHSRLDDLVVLEVGLGGQLGRSVRVSGLVGLDDLVEQPLDLGDDRFRIGLLTRVASTVSSSSWPIS